jgi:inner membrane protein
LAPGGRNEIDEFIRFYIGAQRNPKGQLYGRFRDYLPRVSPRKRTNQDRLSANVSNNEYLAGRCARAEKQVEGSISFIYPDFAHATPAYNVEGMDNLTHTAVGLFLSRAGLGRWSARGTAILLVAANIPDIDLVTLAGGQLNYLHYHRHLTHSLAAMPVMALAAVALVRLTGRKQVQWKGAFFAAWIAVASHLLLDWTNVYGIRLLLPFSGEWFRADTTNVIDLWILAAALVGIAGPFLARLVGSEIGSSPVRESHHGRGFAWFTLLFILVYNCGRGVIHSRVTGALASRMYDDATPIRVAALPNAANPLQWRGLVETADAYVVQEVNLATDPGPARGVFYHKPAPDPAMDAARRTVVFQEFLRFSQFPLWRVTPNPAAENSKVVEAFDMRFGTPAAPGFVARAVVDGNLRVVDSSFTYGTLRPR